MTLQGIAVIPTGFKSKIPYTLSYPAGAEMFSRAFADAPQFSELSVDFHFWSRVQYESSSTYSVVEIAYSRSAKSIHTREDDLERYLKPKWSIVVYAVPRTRRHFIKIKLEESLPLARTWLIRNADHDEVGSLVLAFSFDEQKEALTSSESSSLEPRRST
jgi:hypothetical protein